MAPTVNNLVIVFKPFNKDWLGYKITKDNYLTYHHIFKDVYGDYTFANPDYKLDNGALLSQLGHNYLHIIENRDLHLYLMLSDILREINEQKHMPTLEQYKRINLCLKYFEAKHKKDTNSKGKILIKKAFLNRETYNL